MWNHHLIMIHPRTDTVCKRDASGWVWGFLFLLLRWRAAMRQCGYGVHGGSTTNCGPRAPDTEFIQTSRVSGIRDNSNAPAQNVGARHTALHSLPQLWLRVENVQVHFPQLKRSRSKCWRQAHRLALLTTASNHQSIL